MDETHLRVDTDDAVGRLVIDRPDAHNALDEETAVALADALERLATDDAIRAVSITGRGGTYCTGADLSTLVGDEGDGERIDAIATPLHEAVRSIVGAPKPVVAGVNGVVAGGGLGLALGADVLIVSSDARFQYAYPNLGLSGDGGATWFLPRLIGRRRTQRFVYFGDAIDPAEAVDLGLATEVVDADSFEERLESVTAELAGGPTQAFGEIKRLILEGEVTDLDDHLDAEKTVMTELTDTVDYASGLQAFLEKEAPSFEGR